MKKKETKFYCGTSNIELPVPNKTFYPEAFQGKSRLCYYSSLFNTVEINSTFYKIPMAKTVEKWANEVPPNFRFTFKLWQGITHAKGLNYNAEDVYRFLQVVNNADSKKGCLLVQFPASIKFSYFHKIRQILDDIVATGIASEWKLAIEFRDKSWYNDTVYEMLEKYDASIVVHDMPASATPLIDMQKSFVYLRYHGEQGDYRGGYTDDFLAEHAANIKDWLDDGLPVFAYFNNTIGDAVHNAMSLVRYLE
jgi:uncharacterized protein YecE (DUF72 family)